MPWRGCATPPTSRSSSSSRPGRASPPGASTSSCCTARPRRATCSLAIASPDVQVRAMAASAGVLGLATAAEAEAALERGETAPEPTEPGPAEPAVAGGGRRTRHAAARRCRADQASRSAAGGRRRRRCAHGRRHRRGGVTPDAAHGPGDADAADRHASARCRSRSRRSPPSASQTRRRGGCPPSTWPSRWRRSRPTRPPVARSWRRAPRAASS